MDYMQEYKSKLRTPDEAVKCVKDGDWVDYTTAMSKPVLLDRALAARAEELHDVKIRGNLINGPIEVVEQDLAQEHFTYNTWHCSGYERKLCDKGLAYFMPMVFHNNSAYYHFFLDVNVAMTSVTPMDKHGFFNFSLGTGVAAEILRKADIVIVEVNEHLPKLHGGYDECIHISDVDFVVEGEHELSRIYDDGKCLPFFAYFHQSRFLSVQISISYFYEVSHQHIMLLYNNRIICRRKKEVVK